MTGTQILLLLVVIIATGVVAFFFLRKNQQQIKRLILDRILASLKNDESNSQKTERLVPLRERRALTPEEKSEAELERLQELIEDRKQLASKTDISHHLWNLYKNHFRFTTSESLDPSNLDDDWYGVKILKSSTVNNLNTFEFELKGTRYKFIEDEENRNWTDNVKLFSLILYDDSDRCLIEIPMSVRVDKLSRKYSVLTGGPKAFLPGGWTHDFINATLIHQSQRKKEIRAQKHQERLWEIKNLKDRFGISD